MLGDVFEVTMEFASSFYRPMDCVFFYQDTSVPGNLGTAQSLAEAFQDGIPIPWSMVASADVQYITTRVRNLFDPLDIGEVFDIVPGDIVSETSVAFVAYAYRTNRVRTDIRRGQKRFPGVPEGWVQHGVIEGDHTVDLDALAAAISTTLQDIADSNVLYTPIIVGRILFTNPTTGKEQYRLPVSQSEMAANFYAANTWLFHKITHQSSRGNAG